MALVPARVVHRAGGPWPTVGVVPHDVVHLDLAEEVDDLVGVQAGETTRRWRKDCAKEEEAASLLVSGPLLDARWKVRDEPGGHVRRVKRLVHSPKLRVGPVRTTGRLPARGAPIRRTWGLHERGGLVLSGSFYSRRAASQRRGIRSLPEVQTRHA